MGEGITTEATIVMDTTTIVDIVIMEGTTIIVAIATTTADATERR